MRRKILILAVATGLLVGGVTVPALAADRPALGRAPAGCARAHKDPSTCTVRDRTVPVSKTRRAALLRHGLISPSSVGDDCINGQLGVWYQSRTEACQFDQWNSVRVDSDGFIIGVSHYLTVTDSMADPRNNIWRQTEVFTVTETQGFTAGMTVSGSFSCDGLCDWISANFPAQPVGSVGDVVSADATFQTTITAPGDEQLANTTVSWVTASPGDTHIGGPADIEVPFIRCDNATPGAPIGCIFPEAPIPVFTADLSNGYPESARHIRDAQDSGLPGSPQSGRPLHRLTDPTLIDRNRRAAFCASDPFNPPDPFLFSCDEYPFASTYEGAAFERDNGFHARTFFWCGVPGVPQMSGTDGWSVCWIDRRDNSGAGATLGNWYTENRIIAGDPFYVETP